MILTKISKQPHELEKILAHSGGRMLGVPPVRSTTAKERSDAMP